MNMVEEELEPLIARGWIVRATPVPTDVSVELPEAIASLDADFEASDAVAGPRRAMRCLRSALRASFELRHRSLLHSVRRIGADFDRRPHAIQETSEYRVSEAVAAYLKIRPLLFSARHRCLHDSMTLAGFLADERIAARWVIGVRTRPFAAHSWVQRGGVVLNDQHERVRAYRPILVV